jgi:hypothetical protein
MKLPRELMINGNLWRVKFTRTPGGYPREKVWGFCCEGSREISIATGLSVPDRVETFCHEVIHALEFEYKDRRPSLRKLLSHKNIKKVEDLIAALLIDNQFCIAL